MAWDVTKVTLGNPTRKSDHDQLIDNLIDLAGAGRTTETVKDNYDLIANAIKTTSVNYTVLDDDGYKNIIVTASSTVSLPTALSNPTRELFIINTAASGTVTIDGEDAETIDGFATIELLQQYDFMKIMCDGTKWIRKNPLAWHKFADPPTGWKASKTTWAAADDFDQGLEVTFSEVPAGAKAVRVLIQQGATLSTIYYRKSGDANISNTPSGSEFSHGIMTASNSWILVVIWLSSDYKAQFTITNTATDLSIAYPIEYLI